MADRNVALFGPESAGKSTLLEGLFRAAEYVAGDAELYDKDNARVVEYEYEGRSWAIYDFKDADALAEAAQNGELNGAVMVVNCWDGPIGLHDTMFMLEDCGVETVACAAVGYDTIDTDEETERLLECEIREIFDEHALDGDEASVIFLYADAAANGDKLGIAMAWSLLEAIEEHIG